MKKKFIIILALIFSLIIVPAAIAIFVILNFEKYSSLNNYYTKKTMKKHYSENQYGIFDMFDGSFKTFILHNNTPELLDKLYKNLDEESKERVDLALNAILNVPDVAYMKYFYFRVKKFENNFYLKLNTDKPDKTFEEELPEIMKKYKLPKNSEYFYGVFQNEHCLRYANEKIKNYIKDKVFIDGGAYVGDSALVLLKYEPSIIYSFDISELNFRRFEQTMKMNNVPIDKVKLIKCGISDSIGEHKIRQQYDMEGIKATIPLKNEGVTVKSTDVDSFMKDKNETVGFIKTDVQGIMHKAVTGMKETIKKDRPVLFLDISDSPQDFFYTKPIVEDILKDLNYTIKLSNLNYSSNIVGLAIWAYPKELDD